MSAWRTEFQMQVRNIGLFRIEVSCDEDCWSYLVGARSPTLGIIGTVLAKGTAMRLEDAKREGEAALRATLDKALCDLDGA